MTDPTTPRTRCFFKDTGRGPCVEVAEGDFCSGCGKTICSAHDPAEPMGRHEPEDHLVDRR